MEPVTTSCIIMLGILGIIYAIFKKKDGMEWRTDMTLSACVVILSVMVLAELVDYKKRIVRATVRGDIKYEVIATDITGKPYEIIIE